MRLPTARLCLTTARTHQPDGRLRWRRRRALGRNPPEISDETRALWAAAEQRYKETEQAKDYLKSTGKYSGVELATLDYDAVKLEIRDEALRQSGGNESPRLAGDHQVVDPGRGPVRGSRGGAGLPRRHWTVGQGGSRQDDRPTAQDGDRHARDEHAAGRRLRRGSGNHEALDRGRGALPTKPAGPGHPGGEGPGDGRASGRPTRPEH